MVLLVLPKSFSALVARLDDALVSAPLLIFVCLHTSTAGLGHVLVLGDVVSVLWAEEDGLVVVGETHCGKSALAGVDIQMLDSRFRGIVDLGWYALVRYVSELCR